MNRMQNMKLAIAAISATVKMGNQSLDGKLYTIGIVQIDTAFKIKKEYM